MSKAKPLPETAPCPRGCAKTEAYEDSDSGMHCVQCACGWVGPWGNAPRAAILSWNRRASSQPEPWIVSRPGVLGGKPCVRGTRVTVEQLQAASKEWNIQQMLTAYPQVYPEALGAALAYKLPAKGRRKR